MTVISRSAALMLALATYPLYAQTVDRPNYKEGEKWVYRVQVEENKNGMMGSSAREWETSIVRAGTNSMVISRKPVDSNLPGKEVGFNPDWSIARNINGKNIVTARPLDFPMKPGKTWKLETLEEKPDALTKMQKVGMQYSVVGWEEIKVAAGTFKALKIEAEGEWAKEFEPRGASVNSAANSAANGATVIMQSKAPYTPPPTGGRLYRAYWYAPEIKYFVKNGSINKCITADIIDMQNAPSSTT